MNTDSIKNRSKTLEEGRPRSAVFADCLFIARPWHRQWGRFPDHQRVEREKDTFHLGYR